MIVSCGVGQFEDSLAGFHEPEGLAWSVVEFGGDRVEVVLAVSGEVGAFGEVLPEQPVGVLVGAALPGRVRIPGPMSASCAGVSAATASCG